MLSVFFSNSIRALSERFVRLPSLNCFSLSQCCLNLNVFFFQKRACSSKPCVVSSCAWHFSIVSFIECYSFHTFGKYSYYVGMISSRMECRYWLNLICSNERSNCNRFHRNKHAFTSRRTVVRHFF